MRIEVLKYVRGYNIRYNIAIFLQMSAIIFLKLRTSKEMVFFTFLSQKQEVKYCPLCDESQSLIMGIFKDPVYVVESCQETFFLCGRNERAYFRWYMGEDAIAVLRRSLLKAA